jgi:hypothetical protein
MIVFSYSGSKEKQKRNVRMQQGTHSLHINTQDCMSFFRSSRLFSFFFFYLTKHRSWFFFLFVASLSLSIERVSLPYTMSWQRRYMSVYMCFVSREHRCCPSYSFTHSFNHLSIHVFSIHFLTGRTRLSACMLKLDYIMFQKKRESRRW